MILSRIPFKLSESTKTNWIHGNLTSGTGSTNIP